MPSYCSHLRSMGSDENRDFPVSLLDILLLHGGLKVRTLHVVYFDITECWAPFHPAGTEFQSPLWSSVTPDLRVGRGKRLTIACYGRKSRLSISTFAAMCGPPVFTVVFVWKFSLFLDLIFGPLTTKSRVLQVLFCFSSLVFLGCWLPQQQIWDL